jgi:hypothetical protein
MAEKDSTTNPADELEHTDSFDEPEEEPVIDWLGDADEDEK